MDHSLIVCGGELQHRPVRGAATVAVVMTAVLAPACSSGVSTSGGHGSLSSAAPTLKGGLTGSGSTFQLTFQQRAIANFKLVQPGIAINYVGSGSGAGQTDLASGAVDFAGSDTAPIPASEAGNFIGRTVLYFPVVMGPITVSYNLRGVTRLRLSGPVIAGIFQGAITRWSDPAIAADNPGLRLPGTAITIARRTDPAGTTQNFSQFLVDAAPRVWKLGSGPMIRWPASSRGGRGNDGVASIIKSTPGAVGYVDFADAKANGLTYASILNRDGSYVLPSSTSASLAARQVSVKPDLTFSAIWAPGAGSYPITYQSWDLVYAHQPNAKDVKLLLAWLGYLLGDGQTLLVGLNYAPLPSNIDQLAVQQLTKISS
jgi:phosphate transport system substrate-binding protein